MISPEKTRFKVNSPELNVLFTNDPLLQHMYDVSLRKLVSRYNGIFPSYKNATLMAATLIPSKFWSHLNFHHQYQCNGWYHSPLHWDPAKLQLRENSMKSIKHWITVTTILSLFGLFCVAYLVLGLMTDLVQLKLLEKTISCTLLLACGIGNVTALTSVLNQKVVCQGLNFVLREATKPPPGNKSCFKIQLLHTSP